MVRDPALQISPQMYRDVCSPTIGRISPTSSRMRKQRCDLNFVILKKEYSDYLYILPGLLYVFQRLIYRLPFLV